MNEEPGTSGSYGDYEIERISKRLRPEDNESLESSSSSKNLHVCEGSKGNILYIYSIIITIVTILILLILYIYLSKNAFSKLQECNNKRV